MESKTCCNLCDVCGASFTKNKSLLRHVREKHQGIKRPPGKNQELAEAKRAKIDNTIAVEDIVPEESNALSEEQPSNIRFENHMKTRLKELANRYGLGNAYNSRTFKDAIVEKFQQPTQVLCFKFVKDSPWREDVKMVIEDCFEELIRELIDLNICIIVFNILYKVNSCIYHTYLIVCYFFLLSPT